MDTRVKIGVIITDSDNKILLIKEKIKKNNSPLWNIIKGSYDELNEDIFETALRECEEEVSIKAKLINALGCYVSTDKKDKVRVQFNFLAKIVEGEPKIAKKEEQKQKDEAISEVRWFSKEDIQNMKEEEFISNRIYQMLMDWISKKNKYPLEIFRQIEM